MSGASLSNIIVIAFMPPDFFLVAVHREASSHLQTHIF